MKKYKGTNKVARKLLRKSWSRKAHRGWKIDYDDKKKKIDKQV